DVSGHVHGLARFCSQAVTPKFGEAKGKYFRGARGPRQSLSSRACSPEPPEKQACRPRLSAPVRCHRMLAQIESTWARPDTYMASFTGVEMAPPLPVISADAIAPLSPCRTQ